VKLPNRRNAYIPQGKLSRYLLSPTHAVGKAKSKFFQAIGFSVAREEDLKQQLLTLARTNEVTSVSRSTHGIKYVIEGALETKARRKVRIRTVWIVEGQRNNPRFVTAYPL